MLGTNSPSDDSNAAGKMLAQAGTFDPYQSNPPTTAMAAQSTTPVGGSQPHSNFQPYLCVDFIISLFGIFPSQT